MPRTRHVMALAGVLLATAPMQLVARAAPAGTAPHLKATQTIVSSAASSRAIVELKRSVILPGNNECLLSDRARFQGTAKQAAVVLTALPQSSQSRIVWLAHVTLAGQQRTYDSECQSTSIPAGRYLLEYVHTPGSSSLTLTLPGLEGRGELRLTQPDRATASQLPAVVQSTVDAATASWGARRVLTGRGSVLTLGVLTEGLTARGAAIQGDCLRPPDEADLPDAIAYAPSCPAGGSGSSHGFTGHETWQATLTSNLAPGSYGAGYWFVGTPTHRPLGAVTFWLPNLS